LNLGCKQSTKTARLSSIGASRCCQRHGRVG
jgi:hypothetical protein